MPVMGADATLRWDRTPAGGVSENDVRQARRLASGTAGCRPFMLRSAGSRLDELEDVGIDHVGVDRERAVRVSGVYLQRAVLEQLDRELG
jgi:hypothetical protein